MERRSDGFIKSFNTEKETQASGFGNLNGFTGMYRFGLQGFGFPSKADIRAWASLQTSELVSSCT